MIRIYYQEPDERAELLAMIDYLAEKRLLGKVELYHEHKLLRVERDAAMEPAGR